MTLTWTLRFLYSQFLVGIPKPTFDLTGQTIIITGSNVGLGLEAARHVAKLNAAKIIIAVRTLSKGEIAADDIAKSCNIPRDRLVVWPLDMSNATSIKQFADKTKTLDRLDGAILNAGVLTEKWIEYAGVESHLSVNVLGTLLLTYLLLPTMKKSALKTGSRGRLAVVGSDLMYLAKLDLLEQPGPILEALKEERPGAIPDRYPLSKLLVYCSIHELAQKQPLSESKVVVNVLTPGACKSTLFRDDTSIAMSVMLSLIARSTEMGARTLVQGISTALPDDAHGGFLLDNRVDNGARDLLANPRMQRFSRKWNAELESYLQQTMASQS